MEATNSATPAPQRMNWTEIKAAYPDQWVVLGDLDSDPVTLQLHSAVVIGCGKTMREANASAPGREGERTAHYYTGELKSHRPW